MIQNQSIVNLILTSHQGGMKFHTHVRTLKVSRRPLKGKNFNVFDKKHLKLDKGYHCFYTNSCLYSLIYYYFYYYYYYYL